MSKLELPKTKEELLNLLQGLADETAELRGIVDNIGSSQSGKEDEQTSNDDESKEETVITNEEIDEVEQLLNLD